MHCLFCKSDSTFSKSVEHIIPESLGNKTLTLPPGIVCNKCKNYFAIKVEKPFISSEPINRLRFHQLIPNKRGRFTNIKGEFLPGFPVEVHHDQKTNKPIVIVNDEETFKHIFFSESSTLILPGPSLVPQGIVSSRFLAKMALETMALRLCEHPEGLEYLVNEIQLDPIRNHARRGETDKWPIHVRYLYSPDKKWTNDKEEDYQVVHESDILLTTWGESFFVIAIFGMEMVINYGGPEIAGYERWLKENNNISPLYSGKNIRTPHSPPNS